MATRVGMVGLGLMGQAMTSNLHKADFEVQGFDVDAKRMDELREQGGTPVDSPAAAAQGVDFVLTSLPNSGVVREAVLGPEGIAEGATEGLIIVDTTTSRPEDSAAMAEELAPRGLHFMDAALSGTSAMAWEKDLIVIAGASAEDFEACRAFMAGFTRGAYHMGPVGSGALTKLAINLVLFGNALALAEGLTLGMKAGIDSERLLSVFKDGACGSKVMDQKGTKMVQAEYSVEGPVSMVNKDVGLMLEQGRGLGSPMFLTSTLAQLIGNGMRQLDPSQDYASFIELYREMAGLERRI